MFSFFRRIENTPSLDNIKRLSEQRLRELKKKRPDVSNVGNYEGAIFHRVKVPKSSHDFSSSQQGVQKALFPLTEDV